MIFKSFKKDSKAKKRKPQTMQTRQNKMRKLESLYNSYFKCSQKSKEFYYSQNEAYQKTHEKYGKQFFCDVYLDYISFVKNYNLRGNKKTCRASSIILLKSYKE